MKKIKLYVMALVVMFLANPTNVKSSQFVELLGPLLVSDSFGPITLQDLGTNWVRQFDLNGIAEDTSWSPDGCHLLVHQRESLDWLILNPINGDADAIIYEGDLYNPLWSPNGETIIFTDFQLQGTSYIYLYDIEAKNFNILHEIDGPGLALRWLSSSELLFSQSDGGLYVLDVETKNVSRFGTDLYPLYSQPNIESYDYFLSQLSPNYTLLAIYQISSVDLYLELHTILEDDAAVDAAIDEIKLLRGLIIYDLNEGTFEHHGSFEEFVLTVSWSPSSSQIAILSSPNFRELYTFNVYTFDLNTQEFTYLSNYNIAYYPEFGGYTPTWAWDETMLAVQTLDGPIVYNFVDGSIISLDERMQGELIWSPVIAYEEGQCLNR